jgi:hypothetical protein
LSFANDITGKSGRKISETVPGCMDFNSLMKMNIQFTTIYTKTIHNWENWTDNHEN